MRSGLVGNFITQLGQEPDVPAVVNALMRDDQAAQLVALKFGLLVCALLAMAALAPTRRLPSEPATSRPAVGDGDGA